MEHDTLDEILNELRELRRLYQTLVDKFVSVNGTSEDEVEAIESPDDYADEEELEKALE